MNTHPHTRRRVIGVLSVLWLLSVPASPAQASLIPGNIDFGSIGSGGLSSIMGDLGINLPDISGVLGDITAGIPELSIGGLEDLLNIGDIDLGNILGDMGLPDLNDMFDDILGDVLGGHCFLPQGCGSPNGGGANSPGNNTPPVLSVLGGASASITPGVNPTVAANVDAVGTLTDAMTALGLSEAGQAATKQRLTAAQTGADNSKTLVEQSIEALAQQAEAAEQVVTSTQEQTSTQDVLKTALSGMVSLQVATSSQVAYGRQQNAIDTQLSVLDLHFGREIRDGTFVNGKNLQLLNQQLNQSIQRDMATAAGATEDAARTSRLVHVMR
ncbi:MAG: hypothetical protein AAF821_19270 [Cyanobacteria bacterium P01_D01_bin.156]